MERTDQASCLEGGRTTWLSSGENNIWLILLASADMIERDQSLTGVPLFTEECNKNGAESLLSICVERIGIEMKGRERGILRGMKELPTLLCLSSKWAMQASDTRHQTSSLRRSGQLRVQHFCVRVWFRPLYVS